MLQLAGAWTAPAPDNRRVLLVNARSEPEQPDPHRLLGIPLGVLTLAQELIEEGFDPTIIDQSVQIDLRDRMRAMPQPAMVGISCDGGEQIIGGREIADAVRKVWPGVPVVWGGWGPTLQPSIYEHPSAARWIDIFVRGKGNVAIRQIMRAFEAERSLDGIDGLTWRDEDGGIHSNPDSPKVVASTRAALPYDLIDWNVYMTRVGIANYISASGCPHRCEFCSIPVSLPTFDPTDNEIVIEHLRDLHSRGIKYIVFFDDNFFTSKKRVFDLARRMIESGMNLQWHSNGRVDHLSHVTAEEFQYLRDSGCNYLNVGLETGDQAIADGIKKNIVVDDMYEVARHCERVGIGLTVNFIIGLPGETAESQINSFDVLEKLYRIQPKMLVYWHLYMPSPGTPLWKKHVAEGTLVQPTTLDEMLKFGRYVTEEAGYYSRAPYKIFKINQDRSQAIAWYFFIAYVSSVKPGLLSPLGHVLKKWCRWRYDQRHFNFNLDWIAFYWPRRAKRRVLWARRALVRRWPRLQNVLFRPKPGYKCHFSLIFDPEWKPEDAAPIGGSGGAEGMRIVTMTTACD